MLKYLHSLFYVENKMSWVLPTILCYGVDDNGSYGTDDGAHGAHTIVIGVTSDQQSGTSYWYQKLAPSRAALYLVQVSGTRKNLHKKQHT